MRITIMHKNDDQTEAGKKPPLELIEKMGALIGELAQKGQFLGGEGLSGSATRTRLSFRGGSATVKHGPYAGEHELISAILFLTVKSRDEAITWAQRYGTILGDGELELGPVNEPWDLGLMPKPDDAPLRVLMLQKADRASEAGQGLSARQKADLTRLKGEMGKAGVLVHVDDLQPSARGKRLRYTSNQRETRDGPFSESKELIGGFCVLQGMSTDEVLALCDRYAAILGGTLEMDIRPLYEPDEAP